MSNTLDEKRQRERIALLQKLPQDERIRCLQEQVGLGVIDGPTFTKLLAEVKVLGSRLAIGTNANRTAFKQRFRLLPPGAV